LKRKADYVLDFRESLTSLALLKMSQALREMRSGEVLEIIAQGTDAHEDVFRLMPTTSCEILLMEIDEKAELCRIRLKKTGSIER
jgi:TusA-related sulfurtransferase